jgi:hypothetical protein
MMGFRTDTLDIDEIWGEIEAIASFFRLKGILEVTVSYGFSCNTSRIYEPISVPVGGLLDFIQCSIRQGIYQPGECEMHIEGGEPPMLFVLCHAGDIHFESEAQTACSEVKQSWSEKGYLIHHYPA